MDDKNFTELLLHTAVCAIASDRVVDEREKEALHKIEINSPYFSSDDLSTKLDELLEQCILNFDLFRDNLFKSLDSVELNILEELTLLEISFRIIAADEIEEEAEKDFIKNLREHLKVKSDIITQRFGEIDYLENKESEFKNFDKISEIDIKQIKKDK